MVVKTPSKETLERISAGGIGAILSAILVAAGFLYSDRMTIEQRLGKLEFIAEQNNIVVRDIQRTIKSRMTIEAQQGKMP